LFTAFKQFVLVVLASFRRKWV